VTPSISTAPLISISLSGEQSTGRGGGGGGGDDDGLVFFFFFFLLLLLETLLAMTVVATDADFDFDSLMMPGAVVEAEEAGLTPDPGA